MAYHRIKSRKGTRIPANVRLSPHIVQQRTATVSPKRYRGRSRRCTHPTSDTKRSHIRPINNLQRPFGGCHAPAGNNCTFASLSSRLDHRALGNGGRLLLQHVEQCVGRFHNLVVRGVRFFDDLLIVGLGLLLATK